MTIPKRIKPMLAQDNPYDQPFKEKDFVLQEKLDGTRILAIRKNGKWNLMTRTWKNDVAHKFPEIVQELNKIPSKDVVLDGELTYFKSGKAIFVTALARPETKKNYKIKLMLFDILRYNKDVTQLPLEQRLALLNKIIHPNNYVEIVKTITTPTTFKRVYNTIIKNDGEGVIIKRKGSPYILDSRQHWVKIKKNLTDDAIVIGITHGNGKRKSTFGALILAQYDKMGQLKIIGKTSGFDDTTLMQFYNIIQKMPSYIYPHLHISNIKKWISPKIVIEVKYYEKTSNGMLRHPVFVRIRDDKLPSECKINTRKVIHK